MQLVLLIIFTLINISFTQEYFVFGLDNNSYIIPDCEFYCDDLNCSDAMDQANKCSGSEWIAFATITLPCHFLKSDRIAINCTIFAIDRFREVIPGTVVIVNDYFFKAMNYGCALLRVYSGTAVWFGMVIG